ncbi:MAG: 50S ribosomal protein L15 [Syntrophales bacterium]|jgi:large subunit ribosomal protein L15|nr:50S ribosomal protein L15 [Syntrophales bacterium]MDY0043162.1 50S ribosomal protein L15 [Syntrophales bacterium]
MRLDELKPPFGAKKKKKRVGRGIGSGHGGTSCRGSKGQNARSGGKVKPGFEGGQMPLTRRLPKRGFANPFRKNIIAINIEQLEKYDRGDVVDEGSLLEKGIIKKTGDGVKLLGKGEIKVPLTVRVQKVTKSAREKIEATGGTVEVI